MADPAIPTVELPGDLPAKLARLSERTGRDERAIVGEAVAGYVERELAIVEAIERGRTEIRTGQGLSTDAVFQDVEAAIAEVEAGRAGR